MNHARARTTSKLIGCLYTEAMLLADEARAYFDGEGREQQGRLEPLHRVSFAVESLKVTTRLMHIVAWLLTQRAVEAGEIDGSEPQERRLGEAPASDPLLVERLPGSARQLIRASEDLFARVRWLDEGRAASAPRPSPALALIGRLERAF